MVETLFLRDHVMVNGFLPKHAVGANSFLIHCVALDGDCEIA